jgi:hypothetical protein
MRHPDDMKEKRKLNRNVICHDTQLLQLCSNGLRLLKTNMV